MRFRYAPPLYYVVISLLVLMDRAQAKRGTVCLGQAGGPCPDTLCPLHPLSRQMKSCSSRGASSLSIPGPPPRIPGSSGMCSAAGARQLFGIQSLIWPPKSGGGGGRAPLSPCSAPVFQGACPPLTGTDLQGVGNCGPQHTRPDQAGVLPRASAVDMPMFSGRGGSTLLAPLAIPCWLALHWDPFTVPSLPLEHPSHSPELDAPPNGIVS